MENSDGQQERGYETDRELEILQEYEEERRKPGQMPQEIKPCIMLLLKDEKRLREGNNSFYAAVEMDRVGLTEIQIQNRLSRCGVPLSKARSSAKSAATHRYSKLGCNKFRDEDLCRYKTFEDCYWYRKIVRGRYKTKEKDFWRYGWPRNLSSVQIVLYQAIKWLEEKRAYHPGSRLFVAYREIHEVSGRSKDGIKSGLKGLRDKGLIELKIGKRGTYLKIGTEVKRIWPIPSVSTPI